MFLGDTCAFVAVRPFAALCERFRLVSSPLSGRIPESTSFYQAQTIETGRLPEKGKKKGGRGANVALMQMRKSRAHGIVSPRGCLCRALQDALCRSFMIGGRSGDLVEVDRAPYRTEGSLWDLSAICAAPTRRRTIQADSLLRSPFSGLVRPGAEGDHQPPGSILKIATCEISSTGGHSRDAKYLQTLARLNVALSCL